MASRVTTGFARPATAAEPLDQGRFTLPAEPRVPADLGDDPSAREIERGESGGAARGVPAGLWRRLVAATVDGVLIGVLSLLAMILAALAAIGGQVMAQGMGDTVLFVGSIGAFGAGLAVSLAYSVLSWVHGGQTPGKIFARIQVVGTDGGPIGYGQALARWTGYLVALVPFGLGFLLIPLHPTRCGVHDLLAGTRVVTVPAQKEWAEGVDPLRKEAKWQGGEAEAP
ncbi:MAG: RDD family protein [Candidatus Methylomirabilales bacterium]